MTLHEEIKDNMKSAMKAKDTIELSTMRGVISAFTNELVAKGKKPNEMLTNEEAQAVISRLAKQRKDSIEQFRKGGREDLAMNEEAELIILQNYLPKMMELAEVEEFVRGKVAELGIDDPSKKGLLMKELMVALKGKADGKMVKEVVDGLF